MKKLKLKQSIAFVAVASIPLFAGCWLLGSGGENRSIQQALAYSETESAASYNIQSKSGENALLSDIGNQTGERVDYELPSWTFGVFPGVSAPRLEHGDEFLFAGVPQPDGYRLICNDVVVVDGMEIADGWDPKTPGGQYDIATFTLARTYREVEEIICKDELRCNWWKYFNDYMPVGKYSITFNVSTVSVTQHTHWWNDEQHGDGAGSDSLTAYAGYSSSFTFEVYADCFTIDDSDFNSYGSVNAYEVNIEALQGGDYSAFFLPSSGATFSPNIITKSMVQAEGGANYWAVNADKYFDEEPQMGYNLGSMYNNVYLPESADWSDYIDTPASYKVFYMATMKNYESVPSMSDERYTKFFNVIVYREVSIPVLSQTEFVYTGQEITVETSADIPPAERVLYSVSGNRQTNAGNHKATFTLVDRVHYKWEGGSSEADCEVPFEIVKAPVTLPTLTPRVYTGSEQRADITALKDHNNLPIFTITHGDGHADGSYTEAGAYEIVLTLRDPDNYRWVDEEGVNVTPSGEISVDFVIGKATDSWASPVQLLSWHYGSYHSVFNAVSGAAASKRTVYYSVADVDQTVFAELDAFTVNDNYADELIKLPCGEYYIRASVVDGTNYLPLSSEWVKFEVLPGHNEWTEMPGITPWRYGEYDEEINKAYGAAAHGETEFLFYRLNGDGERIGDGYSLMSEFADEDDYGRIPSGTYEMTVSSNGGENYAGLEQSIVFDVLPGINYWEVTPNIEHWVYGNIPGKITGRARFGEPIFTVMTVDGVEIYNSVTGKNELSAQRPGNYILKARVEASSNYFGLNDYEVEFKVFGTLTNVWLVLPAIQGWTEGEEPNAPRAEAAEGAVSFTYRTAGGDLLGANAPTEAGDYFLMAYVGAIGEYNELSAEVPFTVFPKVLKINSWTVTPNIQGWTEGDTPYVPVGEARVGEVIFSYKKENGTALNEAPTDAGNYILVATVLAEDYEAMTAEIGFTIAARTLKTNSWTVVPNIQGWTQGAEASEPVGAAKAGEVQFIYKTKGGEALADKPTAAGSYVLIATVIAEDYETLTAEIEFTIATANNGDALENPEKIDHSAATLAFMIVFLVLFVGTAAMGLWYFLRTRKSAGKAKNAKNNVREGADDEKNGEDAIRDTKNED